MADGLLGTTKPMDPNGGTADQTVLAVLKQIGDLHSRPLVPDNPWAQIGTALSGFAAGTQGRPNPLLEQYRQERAMQVQALQNQAQIAGTLATIANQRENREIERQRLLLAGKKDDREALQKQIDNYSGFAKAGMGSSDSNYRAFGGRMAAEAMRLMGTKIPDEMLAGLTATPFDAEKVKDALRMKALGVPDAVILQSKGITPEAWQGVLAMSGTDDARKIVGLPTRAEEQAQALDIHGKTLANIQKQIEIASPQFAKDLWTYVAAAGKDPMTATKADWQQAAKDFIAQDMNKALAQAQAQPVSGTLLDSYTAISGAVDNLKTIDTLLKDPKALTDLSPYMGTFEGWAGWREWLGRKAPSFAGQVPEKALVLSFAEDQGKNIVIKARSGAAVAAHEMVRLENEWPNRKSDNFREYSVKHEWAMKTAEVLKRRLEILGGPGGRKALELGGTAGFSQFAADTILQNPLPPPVKADEKTPNLPKGYTVKP